MLRTSLYYENRINLLKTRGNNTNIIKKLERQQRKLNNK